MGLRTTQFLALVLTALALVPTGAHLFELPNKIGLSEEHYFVVQGIYRGWALFGIALFGAVIADLALVFQLRRQRAPFRCAVVALLAMVASLAIFFVWTFPTNQATSNWTVAPSDWLQQRAQWEYSHAVNAVVTLLSFCAVALSTVLARERRA